MDVPPGDHDLSSFLLQTAPPHLYLKSLTVEILGADPREEEIKLDNVCGSDETMLPDTQWVLFKCLKKPTKERTAHLIYTWNFSNYS